MVSGRQICFVDLVVVCACVCVCVRARARVCVCVELSFFRVSVHAGKHLGQFQSRLQGCKVLRSKEFKIPRFLGSQAKFQLEGCTVLRLPDSHVNIFKLQDYTLTC